LPTGQYTLRPVFGIDLLSSATALQLTLLAPAEHRAILDLAVRRILATAMFAAATAFFFLIGDRRDRSARNLQSAALELLFLFQRTFVATQVRGKRLAALLAGPKNVGRQPQIWFLRWRLVNGGLFNRTGRLGKWR
jgi:hypothetical protein